MAKKTNRKNRKKMNFSTKLKEVQKNKNFDLDSSILTKEITFKKERTKYEKPDL